MAAAAIPWLIGGATALSVAGTVVEGQAAGAAGKFEAAQLERQATARYAKGTREAGEAKRRGDIMESKARAAMVAGGGVTTDPGATEQLAKLGVESEYEALTALYEGETEAAGRRAQAKAARFSGKMKKRAAVAKSLGTAISGGTRAYEAYKKL